MKTARSEKPMAIRWGVKHKYKEGMFDQVDRVIYDLKHNLAGGL